VISVTLHLVTVMMTLKMRCLHILIKSLVQTLKSSVMMLSFGMLIYLNMIVIPSLLSAAQAPLSKKSKYWWKSMISEFLNCEEKKAWVIVPKSKVPKGRKIIGNCWVYAEKDDVRMEAVLLPKGSVKSLI
jgi:hypothetical protein